MVPGVEGSGGEGENMRGKDKRKVKHAAAHGSPRAGLMPLTWVPRLSHEVSKTHGNALTVAISVKQLSEGSDDPQILIALLSAVGVEQ